MPYETALSTRASTWRQGPLVNELSRSELFRGSAYLLRTARGRHYYGRVADVLGNANWSAQ